MSLNQRMYKESVVHLYNECYVTVKNNDIMKFSGKWTKLEEVVLSQVTQTEKDKHGMYSLKGAFLFFFNRRIFFTM